MENKDWREEFGKIFEKNEYFGISVRYGQKTAEGEYYQVESFIESLLQSKQEEIEGEIEKIEGYYGNPKGKVMIYLDDLKPIITNLLLK